MYEEHGQKTKEIIIQDEAHPEIPPTYAYTIENFFGLKKSREILDFTLKFENCFWEGTIIGNTKVDKSIRSNKVMYADNIFQHERSVYPLLDNLQQAFQSSWLHQCMVEKVDPFPQFNTCNHSETQVSRYGDRGQNYKWHVDKIANNNRRLFTLVYYFFKEPKKFIGGDVKIANINSCLGGKIISKIKPIEVNITPKNDMAVIFTSTTAHCVTETKSPDKFEDGRFSANIWLGYQ